MESEIKAEFEKSGFCIEKEEAVLQKCLTFCINYNLKPSDLVSSWEVYYLNRQIGESTVKDEEMDGFLLHIQNEQKEAILKEDSHLHFYSINDVDKMLADERGDLEEAFLRTPDRSERNNLNSSISTPQSNENHYSSSTYLKTETPFGQRKNKFVIQYNLAKAGGTESVKEIEENDDDTIIKRVHPSEKCTILLHGSHPENGCKFMYDKIEDRFLFLEERIMKHSKALVFSGIHEEPMDPTVASQRSVFAVGMIYCDGEGRLNEKSTLLQSSVQHSGGQRVRLDLQKLSHFSIFPGQVVGIEGHNPSGHCLIASKILNSIPFPSAEDLPPAKKQAIDEVVESDSLTSNQQKLSLIVAAGPFTTVDNFLFEPLAELLGYASRKLPQLLLLLGPFVDSEHPEIKKGTVDRSFEEIFHVEILKRLRDYVEFIGSAVRVILVPSVRDANHDFVFPQPAFDISQLSYQISSTTNPAIFSANDVKIGCCTMDILKQLSREEISRNPTEGSLVDGDRRSRLAKHILSQRSFYPLYPQGEDVPLDFSLASQALQIPVVPDLLFLPSDLTHFIKILSLGEETDGETVKCMCVNPGRLTKGVGGGTFVEITYHGDQETAQASIISI